MTDAWEQKIKQAALATKAATELLAERETVQKMYCVQMDSTGKHCAIWAQHKDLGCVHDNLGDCKR